MEKSNPIGFFDSGIGGTSIWKEVTKILPQENTIYIADSAHAPYGNKTTAKIVERSVYNTELLLKKNCKIIVVACNTATTNAIKYLRNKYNIPFIGIEPAIKPAALNSKTKAIGILATKGTINSALFESTTLKWAKDINVVEVIGTGLVPLIEKNEINTPKTIKLLEIYLQPMIDANIDYLVLGCSHYPYLIPILEELLPKHVKIIDSGQAVARQTKSILKQLNLINNAAEAYHQFYSNANMQTLKNTFKENNIERITFNEIT